MNVCYTDVMGFQTCRDRKGRIVKEAPYQARATSGEVARVEPNRKWFGEWCHFSSEDSCLYRQMNSTVLPVT